MDIGEAENFLVRGNQVHSVDLFLPPSKLGETIQALKKISIVSTSTRVRFLFSHNRYEQFIKMAESVAGRKIVHGDLKPGEKLN